MSTATSPAPAPDEQPFKPGAIPRAIALFSGSVGYVIKLALLSASNALAAWAFYVLLTHHRWPALVVVVAATAAIDWLYLVPRSWTLPTKFLIPGTVFLIGFQLTPIFYTINVAFSNYSTGHVLTKSQAISTIKVNSLEPPPNGRQFDLAPARDSSGNLVLILHDEVGGKVYVGTGKGLTPLPKTDVTIGPTGVPSAAKGYTLLKGADLFALDQELRTYEVPTTGDAAIGPQGTAVAVELEPTLRYDAKRNVFTRISDGKVFRDNGRGSFIAGADELEPGWKTYTGFRNFSRIVNDPLVRTPFLCRASSWRLQRDCSSRSRSTRRAWAGSASTARCS